MKNKIVYLSILLLAISSVLVYSCGKSGGGYGSTTNPPPTGGGNAVSIVGMSFSPASLTVTKGATVTWTNNDAIDHTVTANDGSFDSGHIAPGGKYSKSFSTAGTVAYHCAIHAGMTGSIVVKAY
jgi:plastocyanin